jgi:CHASE1-domain containing sensor protein
MSCRTSATNVRAGRYLRSVTDWTGLAAAIAPVTTLLGGLGGYLLAGRNEEARDRRIVERESRARKDALAERLEEDRHAFQRDTLVHLQTGGRSRADHRAMRVPIRWTEEPVYEPFTLFPPNAWVSARSC